MDIVAMKSMALKQAVQISMMKKQMDQEQQAGQAITEMMQSTAQINGSGGSLDLKV